MSTTITNERPEEVSQTQDPGSMAATVRRMLRERDARKNELTAINDVLDELTRETMARALAIADIATELRNERDALAAEVVRLRDQVDFMTRAVAA